MSKVRVMVEQKSRIANRDIRFDFNDVQTRNPKLQGKTPLFLFTKDPITRHLKPKKDWRER